MVTLPRARSHTRRMPPGRAPSDSTPVDAPSASLAPALALYRRRAPRYDAELQPFEPLRRRAIALLGLQPGDTVLDLGCGTGLSLPALAAGVGPAGRVLGIEPCPEMLALARERCRSADGAVVELQLAGAEQAPLDGVLADAALFHFTHDILQSGPALAHVLAHLRPGARVVACGLQWAPLWAWPANLFTLAAARMSVSSLDGLERPWWLLAQALPDFRVEPCWVGAIFLGAGRVPDTR